MPGNKHARQEQQQATANMALVIKPERGAEIKILPTSQIGCETQENLQTKHLLLSQIMVHSIEAKKKVMIYLFLIINGIHPRHYITVSSILVIHGVRHFLTTTFSCFEALNCREVSRSPCMTAGNNSSCFCPSYKGRGGKAGSVVWKRMSREKR